MKSVSDPILIFGEALVDIFGEEVVPGGAPFNVARHLAAFGLNPTMITRVGADAHGALILREFDRFGLSKDGVQIDRESPTGQVFVRMTEQGHSFDIPGRQAFDLIDAEEAIDCVRRGGKFGYVYCGTLAQRAETSRIALASTLVAAKAPKYLDLNLRLASVAGPAFDQTIGRAEILKVNDAELQALLSWQCGGRLFDVSEQALDRHRSSIASLMRRFGVVLMIVTLGNEGAAAFDANGVRVAREAGIALETFVDTVGAGDAFSSVVLAGKELGWPLPTSLCRANAFAAAICGIRGAVPSNADFYEPWIAQWME